MRWVSPVCKHLKTCKNLAPEHSIDGSDSPKHMITTMVVALIGIHEPTIFYWCFKVPHMVRFCLILTQEMQNWHLKFPLNYPHILNKKLVWSRWKSHRTRLRQNLQAQCANTCFFQSLSFGFCSVLVDFYKFKAITSIKVFSIEGMCWQKSSHTQPNPITHQYKTPSM